MRVLILGSGVIGVTTAWSIARLGHQVTVIDRQPAAARETSFSLDSQKAIDEALVQQRESLSGVNLDEEAADLLRFQQAYQAAAQVISIADTVFQTFLAAVRR